MKNTTNKNCKKLTLIFLAAVLLLNFGAQLIFTQGYGISVSHVTLEVRGAGAFMVAIILGWRLASYVSHRFMFWGYDGPVARFFWLNPSYCGI
ncbi:MAG: hypothetical protein AB9828_07860 [Sphaerochaetaceae bacterium]